MNLIYRAIRKTAYLCSGPAAALGRRMLKMDRYVTEYGPEMADEFNYVVIFGAGLLWRTGEPSPVLRDRLDQALRVEEESGRAFLFVCSGECRGPEYDEPGKMKEHLLAGGIPEERILLDRRGNSTGATVSRLKHFGIDNAILVTNAFHAPRAAFLAEESGIRAACAMVREQGYLKYRQMCNREGLAQWKDFGKTKLGRAFEKAKYAAFGFLPVRVGRILQYVYKVHRIPHLFRMKRFTEKICYASADPRMSALSEYADKAAVRGYVERCIGPEHIVPALAVLQDPGEVFKLDIRQRVFFKPNHGCGMYAPFDPSFMTLRPFDRTFRNWKAVNYADVTGEQQYAGIPFRILVEQDIRDISADYKMLRAFCFNGRIEIMYITQDQSADTWQVTRNFEPSPYLMFYARTDNVYAAPSYADEMIRGIEKLSKPFPFVRVDVYMLENTWLFSELTFTPHRGLMRLKPGVADYRLGTLLYRKLWDLDTDALLGMQEGSAADCSVVIVAHDREDKLRRAVDSVLKQTVQPEEILIMDSGTRHGAGKAVEDLRPEPGTGPEIRVFELPSGLLAGSARNEGIRQAHGTWIALLDDDDWWEPSKIEKQLAAVRASGKDVSYVYTGSIRHYNHEMLIRKRTALLGDGDLSRETLKRMVCTSSMLMAKKSALEQVGGFDEKLAFWQDTELLIRLSRTGKAACISECLTHIDCTSTKRSTRLSDRIDGWEESVRYINSKHSELIAALSPQERLERQKMIYEDGVRRSDSCGNARRRHSYWKKLWVTTGNPVYLASYLVNLSPRVIYGLKAINTRLVFRPQRGF